MARIPKKFGDEYRKEVRRKEQRRNQLLSEMDLAREK